MTDAELDALVALGEALACDCDDTDGWEGGAPTIRDLIAALTTLRKQRDELREENKRFREDLLVVEISARGSGELARDRDADTLRAIELHCRHRLCGQALSNMEGE